MIVVGINGWLSSLAPVPVILYNWQGPVYQPAGYGDMLRPYIEPSAMETFGALGVYDQTIGNAQRLQQERWIAADAIEGGLGQLFSRVTDIWGNAYATQMAPTSMEAGRSRRAICGRWRDETDARSPSPAC